MRDRLRDGREADTLTSRIFALPSIAIPPLPAARDYALVSFTPGRPVLQAARELMARIFHDFDYDPAATSVATPLETALELQRGVCQDFAYVGIACLRALGLAARYVSSYLETLPPPGQPKLRGADASHAWYGLYLPPGMGAAPDAPIANEPRGTWIDYDPTNDCLLGEQHITTAIGRDYQDVMPVHGVFYGGGEHRLNVAVDVDRLEV